MRKTFFYYLPGVFIACLIGLGSKYLATWVPNLSGVTLAIILGLIIRNTLNLDEKHSPGIQFASKKILALAIILMGLKLELAVLGELGLEFIAIVIIMVCSSITLSYLLGRLLGVSKSFSLLLGIGNGICGSSAIGATAPLVAEKEEEIGLSIGVVNLLGTIGIFLLPLLTGLLKLTAPKSALMIGGTLQAVGQVVAAGFSVSEKVGRLATVVKMGRVLMLGPIVLVLGFFFQNDESSQQKKVSIPPFIVGFFIFSLLGSLNLLPTSLVENLKTLSKILLTIAMAGIGLKINVSDLTDQGPKALLLGMLIFIAQLSLITILISFIS
nr:putative sulfate exporter family transporter [Halanaerobacter jeridensis]